MIYHKIKRNIQKMRFYLIWDGCERAEYLRKRKIIQIGNNCMFQSRNFPMDPKLIKIHDNVTIAANVTLVTHDAIRHMFYFFDRGEYAPHLGCIEIEENVFIGIGSIIMPDVHIGKNSIVAAGSLVLNDVPSNCIVGGVPAKVIGSFDDLHQRRIQEGQTLKKYSSTELESLAWDNFYKKRNGK